LHLLLILKIIDMKNVNAAVDRFLVATETIEMVKQSLFDLSERGEAVNTGRLATIAFVLSHALDILNEFEEDPKNDKVMILNN
jgi:hypothetical protein